MAFDVIQYTRSGIRMLPCSPGVAQIILSSLHGLIFIIIILTIFFLSENLSKGNLQVCKAAWQDAARAEDTSTTQKATSLCVLFGVPVCPFWSPRTLYSGSFCELIGPPGKVGYQPRRPHPSKIPSSWFLIPPLVTALPIFTM